MIPGMLLPRFDYEAPDTAQEAAALLAQADGTASLLAGGTDLLVKMKRKLMRPRLLVSLGRVHGLRGVELSHGGGVRLGALASMTRLADSEPLRHGWTAVAEGAAVVGGPLIRNRATVGGNVVNARPCADTVPPLMALGARLHLQGPSGARVAALDGFISGPGETAIERDEVLTAIEIPPVEQGSLGSCYIKITRRASMEVTVCGCAASVVLDPALRRITRARLVFTSVAPVPLRVRQCEPLLEGQALTMATLEAAAAKARQLAAPITDHRAPEFYRSQMVQVMARRALRSAVVRAGGEVA